MDESAGNPENTQGTATLDGPEWPMVESVHVGYLSLAQAATYLSVSKPTVRRWIEKLALPHYYLPGSGGERGKLLFKRGELERWLRRFRNGLAKAPFSSE